MRIAYAAIILLLTLIQSVAAAEEEPRRWALLVGVNGYVTMRSLDFCVADMQSLRDQLVVCGFPEDQVYLLRDRADDPARLPTKRNIEQRLKLLLTLVKKQDVVVVAFSGHGVQLGPKSYWCPTEADVEDPAGTMVPLDTIYQQLEHCPAALRLVIVDACRNDPSRGKSGDKIRLDAKAFDNPPEGILVLNSCGPNEKSQEDERFKHGVFTHFLIRGLRGAADRDADRRISIGELWEFAGEKTKKHVGDFFNDFQQPRLKGELTASVMRFPITPVVVPLPVEAPFDAVAAQKHQKEWATFHGQQIIQTNRIGMKLVFVPAGRFQMGDAESLVELAKAFAGNLSYDSSALPRHKVRITQSFYLGSHEVTVGQFRRFVQDEDYRTDAEKDDKGGWGFDENKDELKQKTVFSWKHTGFTQTDDHPVVNVSWNDASAFCEWLSRKDGRKYRLPTEAEWEYACRAGTETRYSNGNDPELLASVGNVGDGTAKEKYSAWATIEACDGYIFTSPVGSFPPNAWKLNDLHGNVYEWCSDWYDADYYKNSPTDNPHGPDAGSVRVFRGGGWMNSDASHCRSAVRFGSAPEYANPLIGFRVVYHPPSE